MMEPTVGRIVYYYGNGLKDQALSITHPDQPYAAIIVAVNKDKTVNLCVFDCIGVTHCITNIELIQPNYHQPNKGRDFCTWMPYQIEKASMGDHNSESAEPRPAGN